MPLPRANTKCRLSLCNCRCVHSPDCGCHHPQSIHSSLCGSQPALPFCTTNNAVSGSGRVTANHSSITPFFFKPLQLHPPTVALETRKAGTGFLHHHPNPMTYHEDGDSGRRKEENLTLRIHGDNDDGEYVELRRGPHEEEEEEEPPSALLWWYLAELAVTCTCIGIVGVFVFKWLAPPFIEKVIIPTVNWERDTFSTPVLAVLVVASVALFPTFLLPSSPSMWMAGMTFGYGIGLLLIVPAVAVGVSLPFFIGSFFHDKIDEWLEKYPKRAAVLRAAGGGNWFHQFKAVALIRISPFPYIIYNYCAVATKVNYWPYLCGSLAGMTPDIFASIYTGILMRTLGNTSHKKHTLSTPQTVLDVVGFCMAVGTIIFFTVYAKRRLREFQKENEPLLE